jgi:hypothetical protein
VPVTQADPAFAKLQTVPHALQFVALDFRFVSHPSETRPLQLPKPAVQVIEQAPAVQVADPFAVEQAAPQDPQLVGLVCVFVSQPLPRRPSQLPDPALHETSWQVPVAQDTLAFVAEQATPHPPQSVVVRRFVSQPLFGLPSQLANPDAQVGAQAPAVQLVAPLAFVHATPHAPQLVRLVPRLASQPFAALPSQLPNPALHVATVQTPDAHAALAFGSEQTLPQDPQLDAVVCVFVSHPFVATPSQLPHPATQDGTQAPAVQPVVPWTFVQATPQDPQLDAVVCVFVSQPFEATASQLPKPAAHAPSVQLPPLHVSAAFARSQTTLQPPQSVSVLMFFSQPLFGLPSQLA